MKKLLALITLIAAAIPATHTAAAADTDYQLKPITVVAVTDGKNTGTASLYGKGENFVTDLKVTVKFENYAPYDVYLTDGYSPYIGVFDFGAEDKLLFTSSQTGGSGGYGNYRVYRLKTDTYQLLYDDKANSKSASFDATFKPNGFMQLLNGATNYSLDVYLGYMDREYYDLIFAPDGSVKGETPNVNDISFVSPSLNPASGLWRLETYRSVTAVAEVNRLGYIVQLLDFDNGKFSPSFTEFSISL